MDFKDRVILITGASNGIGRSLAIELATRGSIVAGCGRSEERLQETLRQIRATSPSSIVTACDVAAREQVHAMVGKVLAVFGKIDVLINNAGIGMRRPFAETTPVILEEMIRTNYLGAVYCIQEVLPAMMARGSGHIVNISSVAGKIGTPNMAGYCASKFALNGLSESLYHELKPLGIHVSVICPGPVRTDFNKSFAETPPKSPPWLVISPDAVAHAVIRAIKNNRFEIIMPRWLARLCWVNRLAPTLFRAVFHRISPRRP